MKINQDQNLSRIFESAVVASWADLMRGAQTGLVHIEYGFAPSGTLDYLQVWICMVRGHWLLACGYKKTPSESDDTSVHFHNGYHSEGLARILELVILHQIAFRLPQNLDRAGLLQITTPTQKESAAAAISINDAFDLINSAPVEPVLA